ncbi:pentapeptide repeat-containing protein [Dyella sp. GSA-30]|uniref:pentapeptide repeat-containing protein n=1 Tax=Dyella sp. GSA-30 TaxID=2994496 RepID=UPI00249386F4|nr:pentapeptide repeat-containing protein [Dyella sp. GSA-30]BDU21669.1 hypothetical protein DYGSA30_31260 [Dyella sp. GSA-30]
MAKLDSAGATDLTNRHAKYRRRKYQPGRLDKLERWTKIIGIVATVFGFLWTTWTYSIESKVRSFEQRQKAWSIINEHVRQVRCDGQGETEVPKYHTNSGQIDAVEFLVSQHASLNGIGMPCSEFGGLRAAGAVIDNGHFWMSNFTLATLDDTELFQIDLDRSTLDGATFRGANLGEAKLHGIYAKWTDFSKAKLSKAKIPGSDLSDANFKGAILISANLRRSRVTDADFTGADLADADVEGVCYVPRKANEQHGDGQPVGWPTSLKKPVVCPSDWSVQINDSE